MLLLLLLVGAVSICRAAEPEYAPIVELSVGKVRGLVQENEDGHKVHKYEGIRYGHAERFAKPTPVKSWSDVYNATEWREACPQLGIGQPPMVEPFSTSIMGEDCLYLNVWSPNATDKGNRTVMVWIYGGAFITGTIFTSMYDGQYLASMGNVVVVTVNYRLGPFGFLYAGTDDTPGNLGFHDQILALKWVQENIHHFGGDPQKVTIFGESAGSISVGSLVLSPLTKGLFHRAIMQSGSPTAYLVRHSQQTSLENTKELATNLNCSAAKMEDTIKCLRSKSTDQILNGFVSNPVGDHLMSPIYGDEVLPHEPEKILESGSFNHNIDLMYGTVQNEGAIFIWQLDANVKAARNLTVESTRDEIKRMMTLYKKPFGDEVAHFYLDKLANSTQDQLKNVLYEVWGDQILTCPTILFGEKLARLAKNHHIYSYRLMQPTSLTGCSEFVCHAEDIIYLFMLGQIKAIPNLYNLSRDMIHAWTEFAKTGHPTKMGQVAWTEAVNRSVSTSVTQYMNLESADYKMVPNYYREMCDIFWKPKIFA